MNEEGVWDAQSASSRERGESLDHQSDSIETSVEETRLKTEDDHRPESKSEIQNRMRRLWEEEENDLLGNEESGPSHGRSEHGVPQVLRVLQGQGVRGTDYTM